MRAGETAQWLSELNVLTKDAGLIPNTHNHPPPPPTPTPPTTPPPPPPVTAVPGNLMSSSDLHGTRHTQTNMQEKHKYT